MLTSKMVSESSRRKRLTIFVIIAGFCKLCDGWGNYYVGRLPPPSPPFQHPQPILFPGEVDYSGSYRNGKIGRRHHEASGDFIGPKDFEATEPKWRNSDPPTTLGRCSGVCIHASQCHSLGGTASNICSRSGLTNSVCCEFPNSCNQASAEVVSSFQSPGYPGPTLGNLICQYDVIIKAGICAVKLEFLEFNTTIPLDRGICNIDQLLVMNSMEGATFPRCGDLTGYSTIVPVDARHKLPLTLLSIIQSSTEQFKWNIRVVQVNCGSVPRIRDHPNCGKSFHMEPLPSLDGSSSTTSKSSSGEKTTLLPLTSTDPDSENVVFDEPEQIYYNSFPSGSGGGGESRPSVDNAFYVAYLKQAYEAIVLNSTSGGSSNSTLCKNKKEDIGSDKLRQSPIHSSNSELFPFTEDEAELGRIIRGDEAFVNEFPWQVSLQDEKGHVCGGAIISSTLILTAAHCYMSIAPVPLHSIKVVVGDLNFNSTTESVSEAVAVSSVVFHSHFDPYYLENDVALIKLKGNLTFRAGVQPICLPERGNSYTGQSGTISGWGATTYPHGKIATYLQKSSNNRIIENSECKKKLKIDYLYETMLCAVAPNCSGTCFGDSGGPLTVKGTQGRNILVGLVSFGIGGCAWMQNWPDVYSRVTQYLDWLDYAAY